jgi:hypothetical protein
MEDTPDQPEQPQRPKAQCPLQTCDTSFDWPESGNLEELEPVLREHTDSHSPQEFMNTIGILQDALFTAHGRIAELEAALRGANFIMQQAGLVPGVTPGAQQQDVPEGLYLPESAVEGGGKLIVPGKAPKHGDVVPGRGQLVGKKITDPKILKQLRERRNGSG